MQINKIHINLRITAHRVLKGAGGGGSRVELADLFQVDLAGARELAPIVLCLSLLGAVQCDRSILIYTAVKQNFCRFLN